MESAVQALWKKKPDLFNSSMSITSINDIGTDSHEKLENSKNKTAQEPHAALPTQTPTGYISPIISPSDFTKDKRVMDQESIDIVKGNQINIEALEICSRQTNDRPIKKTDRMKQA